ncbi:MAG: ATP-binding protein, partial [Ferruginibacter sp.]
QKAMEEMGDIVWAIKPSIDEDKGLSYRIKNYGTALLSVKNILCRYDISAQLDRELFNAEARKNLLLIIKEAINNMAKYSRATQASITLTEQEENIMLTITDNGIGFNQQTVLMGNGIANMQNRSRNLDAVFQIISKPLEGTQIICIIPLTKFGE